MIVVVVIEDKASLDNWSYNNLILIFDKKKNPLKSASEDI